MRIASVDVCLDPGYLVLICTHIIIKYLSINVISLNGHTCVVRISCIQLLQLFSQACFCSSEIKEEIKEERRRGEED